MVTTGAVTSNEINVTLQAQGLFTEYAGKLWTVGQLVEEWGGIQLTQNALRATPGTVFGLAIGQWVEDLSDIKNSLAWMAEQLGNTAQQLQAGNQQNEEMAAQLPKFNDSTSLTALPNPNNILGPTWSPPVDSNQGWSP
jgi:hypothetical protein